MEFVVPAIVESPIFKASWNAAFAVHPMFARRAIVFSAEAAGRVDRQSDTDSAGDPAKQCYEFRWHGIHPCLKTDCSMGITNTLEAPHE